MPIAHGIDISHFMRTDLLSFAIMAKRYITAVTTMYNSENPVDLTDIICERNIADTENTDAEHASTASVNNPFELCICLLFLCFVFIL